MEIDTPEQLLAALTTLETNLPQYLKDVGATGADLTAVSQDRANLAQGLTNQDVIAADGKASTAIKNIIFDGDPHTKVSDYPSFGISPLPFPDVPGGCLSRYRMLKAHLKSSAGYTKEIGLALGFETTETGAISLDGLTGAAVLKDLGNYQYEAAFRKMGATGMQFQERLKGTEKWADTKTAVSSPIVITVAAPAAEGAAVQIEVRCRPMKGNDLVGSWSPIYPLTVNP